MSPTLFVSTVDFARAFAAEMTSLTVASPRN